MLVQKEPDPQDALPETGEPQKKVQRFGNYEPEVYKSTRLRFIEEKTGSGVSFKIAAAAWDLSDKKRDLLSGLSIPELKRRRFLPKGATRNPWA